MVHRILIIGFYPVINGTASFVMGAYRNLDKSRFQYDFLISNEYKDYHYHLDEIQQLGGRLYNFDYNKDNFHGERIEKLKDFLIAHPEIIGVHVHDTRWQCDPLVLANELGLPVKVIQCHTAYGRSKSNIPLTNSSVLERIQQIKGSQYIRLACSDLAGIYGYQGLPYEVMPNGIDTKKFVYNPLYRKLIRNQLNMSQDSYVIGFVANDGPFRNASMALQVFQEFHHLKPDSHLLIVGSQYNNPAFKNALNSIDCADYVHLLHAPSAIEMLYSAMDIALCTSLSEGLPFTMIEAQATGLPCLISDEVSSMVCITDLAEQFSLDKTSKEWAEKMLQMLEHHSNRESQTEAVKASGYDIQDVTNRLMNIYQKCIDDSTVH